MMFTNRRKQGREDGQTNILLVLMLGIFFLGFIGFAVDFSNFWFHRRAAQAAADAACQAGAMDLLVNATNGSKLGNFPNTTGFDCATAGNQTATPCAYAALNGYPSAAITPGTPGTDVTVSFPSSVPGATPPPAGVAPVPFIKVNIDDSVQTFFSGLITGKKAQDVGAAASCGLQLAASPIPIIVLNPTCQHSFQVGDAAASLIIIGGPNKSVEVNSANTTCAASTSNSANSCSGNATIDLSQGGPNFTGSDFGSFGAPTAAPTNFKPGTTGAWLSPSTPIADPFASVPAPTLPTTPAPAPAGVLYTIDGCPDHSGCIEYFPGLYTSPIVVGAQTAIFVPGLYYIKPSSYSGASAGGLCGGPGAGCTAKPTGKCNADLYVQSNGVIRPATNLTTLQAKGATDGSGGVVFYLSGSVANGYGSAVFDANAGKSGGRTIDNFPANSLSCDGSAPNSKLGIPPTGLTGNVLLGQCTTKGTYIGKPSTDTVPGNLSNATRGLIIFQDRANGNANAQTNMNGGGGLAISGTIYAHDCPGSPSCDPTADYQAFFNLGGGSGTGTLVIGEIVTDQLIETGSSSISMTLNPNHVFFILKAELLQ